MIKQSDKSYGRIPSREASAELSNIKKIPTGSSQCHRNTFTALYMSETCLELYKKTHTHKSSSSQTRRQLSLVEEMIRVEESDSFKRQTREKKVDLIDFHVIVLLQGEFVNNQSLAFQQY